MNNNLLYLSAEVFRANIWPHGQRCLR